MVTDPNNAYIKKAHHSYHAAYLKAQMRDIITCLSPPIWVYSDETRLAGEWCMLGAHYTTDPTVMIPMTRTLDVGLIPFSTVVVAKDA